MKTLAVVAASVKMPLSLAGQEVIQSQAPKIILGRGHESGRGYEGLVEFACHRDDLDSPAALVKAMTAHGFDPFVSMSVCYKPWTGMVHYAQWVRLT